MDRKKFIMTAIVYCLIAIILISFVYTADLNNSIKNIRNSVRFVSEENDVGYEYHDKDSHWTYTCENPCTRKELAKDEKRVSLETCSMLCFVPPLWPKPTSLRITNNGSSTFSKNQMTIKLNAPAEVKNDLKAAANVFMNHLPVLSEPWIDDEIIASLKIYINVINDETKLKLSTNESYTLSVRKIEETVLVNISAQTYFGARHGLETLSQLIWFDSVIQKLQIIHDIEIQDKPAFPHRGLMVDTARNYFPIEQLKKVVEGMAATKLNVFHLHLTDAVSFPIVLPNNKIFAEYGAYSPEMIYTPEDIKGLVEYARIRGIRIILEIDAPSHTNEGWNHGAEKLVICGEDNIFNGHLNPDNTETFNILESIYKDLLELGTDDGNFHIGGDEVNLTCWRQTAASRNYIDPKSSWANFTNTMLDTVKSANKNKLPNVIIWSSPLTDTSISQIKYKDNVVVQYWFGSVNPILENGNKIIFSTVGHWYLDCGFGPWKPSMQNGVCDPFTPWKTFYNYRPWAQYPNNLNQVLGGEACLWSEQVDTDTLETRIWPRAAALAERLWSDIASFENNVFTRLDIHRQRLKKRGIKAAAIWPRWCSQNPGKC